MIEPLTPIVKRLAIELFVTTCLHDLGLSRPGIEPLSLTCEANALRFHTFYAPEIKDRGGGILFLSCVSFCNSVLLSETFTLTLLVTFEQ